MPATTGADTPTSAEEAGFTTTSVQRTSRDLDEVRLQLQAWLATQLPAGCSPTIAELGATSANGMSSETLLFEADWLEGGEMQRQSLVARVAPNPADIPVFPTYDMQGQFDTIRLVNELTTVPVPPVRWCEPGTEALGTPFFVMDRVNGVVPPDVAPYTFGGNWLFDATREQQQTLQDSTIDVIATLHGIDDPEGRFGFLAAGLTGETALHRHVARTRRWYEYAAAGVHSRLVEAGFRWLEENWPKHPSDTVLSWGDSRIGNVMYDDFRPVAVLDWEMAGLGPREIDLGWICYSHSVFQEMTENYGMPGMPHLLQPEDAAARYEKTTGIAPRDLEFYRGYAAVQWGIVGLITGRRSVHFGEREQPEDIDELMLNRASLERLVS
jgi:aminoglycoside phosphotransferase (APT) family kinase protein